MESNLQDARRTFPKMPEEVFTLWLDGRILAKGWPPKGIEWEGFLLERSIREWQQLNWTKKEVSISWAALAPRSRLVVQMLINGNVNRQPNPMTAYIPDSKIRFQQIMKYTLDHQNIPGTLVLLKAGPQYEVVEGNHRVAVLIALQSYRETKDKVVLPQAAWVGEPADTEPSASADAATRRG